MVYLSLLRSQLIICLDMASKVISTQQLSMPSIIFRCLVVGTWVTLVNNFIELVKFVI